MTWRLALALALFPLVGCVATRTEAPLVVAPTDAGAPSAPEVAPAETAADAAATPAIVHCNFDEYWCNEYIGMLPYDTSTCEDGACGPPVNPATDICVVSPGHLLFYYHLDIPVDGGSIPYGPLPPANCVHP
jgi:hypothetical protein